MAKVIVEFLKTHTRYVKGDIAGFAAETVAAWPKGVCKPYDPNAPLALEIDTAKAHELDVREAELKAREDALAAREAALASEGAEATPALDATEEDEAPPAKTTKAPAGAPPKQGAKK